MDQIGERRLKISILFQQALDGLVERFRWLDDVIVLPEVGVAEIIYFVEESIALVERLPAPDRLHVAVGATDDSQFAECGKRG